MRVRLLLGTIAVALAATTATTGTIATPSLAQGGNHALIQGSGSSWSANAVNQWIADVQPNGLQVVFTPNGSAQGRKDFGYRTNDFAVTEIGFQGVDSATGESDTSQGRGYAYLPIVAGGTSFPYQIRVHGDLVRDLRLSGLTLAKIFTNQITSWDDPAITADNNGRVLPALPIIPVVHSEGSGSTAHFTDYLDQQFPDLWQQFNGQAGLTEYYPREGNAIAQSGSEGVMNFITSSAGNGAIGFDEYSYPLGKNYPVAKIENPAGYFTLPTQYNVAVALTQAVINHDASSPNYLLQDLANVYKFDDPRSYVLSSYSYMLVPTAADDSRMTTAKRQTIADFLYYSICDGQKEMGPIGYSPLPVNLVQAGFEQISRLHDADANVDLTSRDVSTCNNPTFDPTDLSRNKLAEIAPQPLPCDQFGQPLCDPNAVAPAPGTGGSAGATPTTVALASVPAGGSATTSPPGGATEPTTVQAASTDTVNVATNDPADAGSSPPSGSAPAVDVQTGDTLATAAGPVAGAGSSGGGDGTGGGSPGDGDGQTADGLVIPRPLLRTPDHADQPTQVAPSSSFDVLWPVVGLLALVLVCLPVVKIQIGVRRRRAVR